MSKQQEKDKAEQNPSQGKKFTELVTRLEASRTETTDVSDNFKQLMENLAKCQSLIDTISISSQKSESTLPNGELKKIFSTIHKENCALKEVVESLQVSCDKILLPAINLHEGTDIEMPQSSNVDETREVIANPGAEDCELKQSTLRGPFSSETATSNLQPATGVISKHHLDQEYLEKNDCATSLWLQDASKAPGKTDALNLEEPIQKKMKLE